MGRNIGKSRTIKVLEQEVDEKMLQNSLIDVLEKRGLRAHLIIEDEYELKKVSDRAKFQGDYSDYGNIYKYAFF